MFSTRNKESNKILWSRETKLFNEFHDAEMCALKKKGSSIIIRKNLKI